MKNFFFGCYQQIGHYLYTSVEGYVRLAYRESTPWGSSPDGSLAPHTADCDTHHCHHAQPQGGAVVHHKDGWTALGMWDRTMDHRTNSNSNFFFEGTYSFEEILKLAEEFYPEIVKRIGVIKLSALPLQRR